MFSNILAKLHPFLYLLWTFPYAPVELRIIAGIYLQVGLSWDDIVVQYSGKIVASYYQLIQFEGLGGCLHTQSCLFPVLIVTRISAGLSSIANS